MALPTHGDDVHIERTIPLADLVREQRIRVEYRYLKACLACGGYRMHTGGVCDCPPPAGTVVAGDITVQLPPGKIHCPEMKLRLPGLGHEGLGGRHRGDLVLTVHVSLPEGFRLEGKDLHYTVPITPMLARFGGKLTFPTLDGGITQPVDPGIPDGNRWHAKGLGAYTQGDTARGHIQYTAKHEDSLHEQRGMKKIRELERQIAQMRHEARQSEATSTPGPEPVDSLHEQREMKKIRELEHEIAQMKREARDSVAAPKEGPEPTATDAHLKALVTDLLPAMDSLEKALGAMSVERDASHRAGIEMIVRQQREALARHGVTVIPALGKRFDPHWHEAVSVEKTSNASKGTVTQVLQTGYAAAGRLLRPARVVVSH